MLVFGTNTELGVAVSANATSTPGVTIGYKRQEAVLMPLFVNGADSKLLPLDSKPTTTIADGKYVGIDGAPPKSTDTYSVLAVFGATASGKSGEADIGIAQYFATGLAARTLAYAGGSLVSTSKDTAEASKTTSASAAAAKSDTAVASLIAGTNRFQEEGSVQDSFAKLTTAQQTAYLANLNTNLNRVAPNTITSANLQTQLGDMNNAELQYAFDQVSKQ